MQASKVSLILFIVLISLSFVLPTHSAEWPQRSVIIVVPFAAGGNTDSIARITGQRLGEEFESNLWSRTTEERGAPSRLKRSRGRDLTAIRCSWRHCRKLRSCRQ